ncbi:MAG: hypothetical protein IJ179_11255 [Oscillospiraceae bacterium]|nr:hypothetical protein [Oscillospiraceae bacterium]MBQ9250928.1 hypothetical protein [Oscillospiraceae bacterium]
MSKNSKSLRGVLALALVLVLLLGLGGVSAFAVTEDVIAPAGGEDSVTKTLGDIDNTDGMMALSVETGAEGADVTVNAGDISSTGGSWAGGVEVYVDYVDSSAEVNTGAVSVVNEGNNASGVFVNSEGGSATVSVGDVSVEAGGAYYGVGVGAFGDYYTGNAVPGSAEVTADSVSVVATTGSADGVDVYAMDGSTAAVTVGDVSADSEKYAATGISITAKENGTAVVTAGDVSANSAEGYASGVTVDASNGGTVEVSTGSISATSDGYGSSGITSFAQEDSTITITVDGDVIASGGEGYEFGVDIKAQKNSTVTLQISGDLSGDTAGLSVRANGSGDEMPTVDVAVEGTISGGKPVTVYDKNGLEALTLTVWQIEADEDGNLIAPDSEIEGYGGEQEFHDLLVGSGLTEEDAAKIIADKKAAYEALQVECAEAEKNILYIIKLEQPKAGGKGVLGGVTDSMGFDAAKEGETVTVTANVENGYKLVGVYNNGVKLLQDANGAYYLVVPKGGGVSLSLTLEKLAAESFGGYGGGEILGPKILGTAETTNKQGQECTLTFYSTGKYKLDFDGYVKARGAMAMQGDELVLLGHHRAKMPVQADGTLAFPMADGSGETLNFQLDDELMAKIKDVL